MFKNSLPLLDYTVITGYLSFVFYIAFRSGRLSSAENQHHDQIDLSVNNQYLANKSLTFKESLFSIIATETSALTFLGIPAFAFAQDFSFVQIYFGAVFGRFFIAKVLLPKVYDKGLTIYSTMNAGNGTINGLKVTSLIYMISKLLAIGVRLFSGSILIAEFFAIDIYLAIAMITIITYFYTLIGGLKAVVRTDMLQLSIFVIGGLLAHFIIPFTSEIRWLDLMNLAQQAGKTEFFNLDSPWPFISGVLGGMLFDVCTHGVDQDYIQRLLANQSLKKAKLAITLSSFLSIAMGFLFLSVGALLWSYYEISGTPIDFQSDYVFAHFINQYFPHGLRGLMVSGVLAATMSTLDSTINALSSCMHNDLFPHRKRYSLQTYIRLDTSIITLILLIIAFSASHFNGLLVLGLKVQSWTGGVLFSIFVVTMLTYKYYRIPLSAPTALIALIFGILGVYINTFVLKWIWHWNIYFGTFLPLIALFVYAQWYRRLMKRI